jgi:hypothetical protein
MKSQYKKAMSEVISGMLMVGLVLVLIAAVWVVINNVVGKETKNVESCFGNFDKVKINRIYTCYNSSPQDPFLQFSINVEDILVDNILVSVASGGNSKTITLSSEEAGLSYLSTYPSYLPGAVMPSIGSGKTYMLNMTNASLTGIPDSIQVAATINGQKCQVSDSLENIDSCDDLF